MWFFFIDRLSGFREEDEKNIKQKYRQKDRRRKKSDQISS